MAEIQPRQREALIGAFKKKFTIPALQEQLLPYLLEEAGKRMPLEKAAPFVALCRKGHSRRCPRSATARA